MKAKLLTLTFFCFTIVGIFAQTVTRTENFSNYGGTSPYAGVPVGSSQIVWEIQVGSLGTLNGNALILGKDGVAKVTVLPHGISDALDFSLFVTNDNNQDCSLDILVNGNPQGTISIGKKTTAVQHTLSITDVQYSDFTLEIQNTSGGNRSLTIDDVSWSGYSSIREIQYTTIPGDGTYPSLEVGNIFTLYGTVTGVKPGVGYYIQDNVGLWNGIWVVDATTNPSAVDMDIVSVTGTIQETNGRTEINASSATITGSTGEAFNPVLIYEPITEGYESVVSYINYSSLLSGTGGNYVMTIGFNPPYTPITIDNDLYTSTPIYTYNEIQGPVNYNGTNFSISPRDISDLAQNLAPATLINDVQTEVKIYASFSDIVTDHSNLYNVEIYNLAGQKVKELSGVEGRTEINMEKGVYIVRLQSENTSLTEKVLVK